MIMSNLDDLMRDSYHSVEQEEKKAQQVEEKIKAIPGASSLLPARQYGKPVPVDKFGITLPYGNVVFSIKATFSHINSGELLLVVTATLTSSIHLTKGLYK